MTGSDRRFTALMLLVVGVVVAAVLYVFEMSTALVIGVFVAFVFGSGLAFVKGAQSVE